MKDAGYAIRDAVYNALNGLLTYTVDGISASIDVYSYVAHAVDYPFVIIHPILNDAPDYTKGTNDDIHDLTLPIEVIFGFEKDAGDFEGCNEVMNQIIERLVKVMLPMQDYTMHVAIQQNVQEFREQTDTHEIIRKYLSMKYIVERK